MLFSQFNNNLTVGPVWIMESVKKLVFFKIIIILLNRNDSWINKLYSQFKLLIQFTKFNDSRLLSHTRPCIGRYTYILQIPLYFLATFALKTIFEYQYCSVITMLCSLTHFSISYLIWPFNPSWCLKASFCIPKNRLYFAKTKGFQKDNIHEICTNTWQF